MTDTCAIKLPHKKFFKVKYLIANGLLLLSIVSFPQFDDHDSTLRLCNAAT